MSNQITELKCLGLATDQSALTALPGAMRIADDVVIDRPGVASARPGFAVGVTKSTDFRPRSMHAWSTLPNYLFASYDGATWRMETEGGVIPSVEAEPRDRLLSFPQFVEARKNCYWTSKKGAYKSTTGGVATGSLAGWHDAPGGLVGNGTTPGAIANGDACALRWVFVRRDANNVETRSMPSPWIRFDATGASYDPQVTIPLPSAAVAGDRVEVYRSKAVAAASTPSDQMYLALKYTLLSADISAGSATLNISRTESQLGAELYTNSTREGILKGNGRPPASHAIALWADCVWYGGTRGPFGARFAFAAITGLTINDGLLGVQRLQRSGSVTSGSPTINLGAGTTTSVKIGQLITNGTPGTAPTDFPMGATVIGKTANTITMSANATGTSGPTTFYVHDGITADGTTIWASSANKLTTPYAFAIDSGGSAVTTGTAAMNFAYVFSMVSSTTYALGLVDPFEPSSGSFGSVGTVLIRSVDLDDTLWAMSFVASETAITYDLAASGIALVERDDWPDAAYYSKPDEPEHVPPLNYLRIGSEASPVLAFAPLRGALIVFKQDGIFRITGSAPDGWRVDQISSEIVLRGECVSVLGDRAYAWCDRGVYEVSEGGAANITDGAIGRALAPSAQRVQFAQRLGAFVATWPNASLVLVGVPTYDGASNGAYADEIYCFHTGTRAWTRWNLSAYCMAQEPVFQALLHVRGGAFWEMRESRFLWNGYRGHDASYTISDWTYTAGSTSISISDAQRGSWDPKAGDWVSMTVDAVVAYRRVLVATDAGASYTLTIDSAFPSGAITARNAYEGIVGKLQWQGKYAGPAKTLHMRGMHALFDWTDYDAADVGGTGTRITVGAQTDNTPALTTSVVTGETRAAKTIDVRMAPDRALARAAHVMPYLELSEIGLPWRCLGIVLDAEPVSERTNR